MRYAKKREFGFKRRRVLLAISLLLLGIGGAGLAFQHLAPETYTFNPKGAAFDAGFDLSYEDGQKLYKEATKALKNHRPQQALDLYARIEGRYPHLRPVILMHQAEAFAELEQEGRAQEALRRLTKDYVHTPLAALGWYKLGQSCMRSRDNQCAQDAFDHVTETSKPTDLSVAANYYLGELAEQDGDSEAAAHHYSAYLQASQDGTFSALAAQGLDKTRPQKTAEDHYRIGMALFHQQSWKKALVHLEKAPLSQAWVTLGKTYYRVGDRTRAMQTFERGLHFGGQSQQAEEGIKSLLSLLPDTHQKIAKLTQILKTHPKSGGDFILWQLSRMTEGQSRLNYDHQLVSAYGNSNWAPETSWELAWADYKAGHSQAFLERAQNHLLKYPRSNSAPRVLFWKAKHFLRQNKPEIAEPLLEELVKQYPHQYYAFRAGQILENSGSPWRTMPENPYPPSKKHSASPEVIAEYADDRVLSAVVTELFRIESPEDVTMLLQAQFRSPAPAPLLSMVYHQKQQYPQSLRVLRDYLDDERKQGRYPQKKDVYKLLYPVVYDEQVARYAQANRLDPYLVQALMRQESYFNPVAVSSSQAMGLMQLLPSTAQGVAQWEKMSGFHTAALFTPEVNVRLGTRYLRYLHDTFNGNSMMSVGGYNGGPGAMGRWVKAYGPQLQQDPDLFVECIPYTQSRDYVKEVFSHYWNYLDLYQP